MAIKNLRNDNAIIMKTKQILYKMVIALVLVVSVISCENPEELIEELQVSRAFAPVDIQAFIRKQTTVELNWTVSDNVQHYVAEFSEDENFSSIVETKIITPEELPSQTELIGETLYYVRVKAVSNSGLNDSSWATTTAQTLTEQLFISSEAGDIAATEATLRWVPDNKVTQLIVTPGDITYDITPQEAVDGVATISGLTGETDYTVTLLNDTVTRGVLTFTTGIDVGDNTLVLPTDDLFQMIADASPGDILLLEQGDYTDQTGSIELDKSITIQGLRVDFKPLLSVDFKITDGATDVSLIDLDLDGKATIQDVVRYTEAGQYNSLLISGCNIHDYDRSFIAGNTSGVLVQSVKVENSIMTNIVTSGGDFIDFRSSNVLYISVTTSTFNNCAPERDFFRIDNAGDYAGQGLTCNILVDSSTLYACSNKDNRRILYVRFDANEIEVKNTLITHTAVEAFSDQGRTDENTEFNNNNYFEAPTLFTDGKVFDSSASDLDPGYVNAEEGDFTLKKQTLIDNKIGDPRWHN